MPKSINPSNSLRNLDNLVTWLGTQRIYKTNEELRELISVLNKKYAGPNAISGTRMIPNKTFLVFNHLYGTCGTEQLTAQQIMMRHEKTGQGWVTVRENRVKKMLKNPNNWKLLGE